ncbi:hypothetical protein SAMD00019534_012880 [Acytostelium subglobosum LB1]|uniref:hypothetical protein n=1 Tax=Acytostelium subglobosum LB1 TaxID=1410327 RepID=UPI000644DA95|nr:hypothetical protein SAMD00019534_012880 [Acytostelium subglobosum LB1]GAM18113.1 hypothetical protein SAMD00019534_012880 [Acytostelium subglobosum LB1]|eukprot:XP_012758709.1 hypothetical protein SAMD00019534_012880 [Acytostelium subglobosum LB1]
MGSNIKSIPEFPSTLLDDPLICQVIDSLQLFNLTPSELKEYETEVSMLGKN